MKRVLAALIVLVLGCESAWAQSTSIGKNQAVVKPSAPDREKPAEKGNPTLERHSLIAVQLTPPKEFKVHDLVTVIVREQTTYEAEGTADTKRKANLKSQLDAFIKFTGDGIGAALFRRGKPNIEYKSQFDQKNDAETDREDKLTTRITAEIVDVKPNGNLVLEAYKKLEHGDETVLMTVTGVCRSVDVTPDNTVLSTQIAKQRIIVTPDGTIRNATKQGWLAKLIDLLRPL